MSAPPVNFRQASTRPRCGVKSQVSLQIGIAVLDCSFHHDLEMESVQDELEPRLAAPHPPAVRSLPHLRAVL